MSKKMCPLNIDKINSFFPVLLNEFDTQQRDKLWKKFDFNCDGSISLFEIQCTIQNMGPQFLFLQKAKEAQKYAFNTAQKLIPSKDKRTINKEQFRTFLVYLRCYFQCQIWFDQVDENNDKRLSINEFLKSVPLLEKNLDIKINNPKQEFKNIDVDNGGMINFNEFADYCLQRNTHFEKKLNQDLKGQEEIVQINQNHDKSEEIQIEQELQQELQLTLDNLNIIFPILQTESDISHRKILWRKFDINGDGMISKQEIDKSFKNLGIRYDFIQDMNEAQQNAFQTALKRYPNKDNDNYLHQNQFRLFLIYLKLYFQYQIWFETVDFDQNKQLTIQEFKSAIPLIESYWGSYIDDPYKEFQKMDIDKSGIVSFHEFADYCIQKSYEIIQFDQNKEDYLSQQQYFFTNQKKRIISQQENSESIEKQFNFSDESENSDNENKQINIGRKFNFQLPDFQTIKPTQQDQPLQQESQYLQEFQNFQQIFNSCLNQCYKDCIQIKQRKFIKLEATIYPFEKIDKNKTKSELVCLSMIKFLPFLGEKILDGFYSSMELINEKLITKQSQNFLQFFTNQEELQQLSTELLTLIKQKLHREIIYIDDKQIQLKQWVDKIKMFGIMLDVQIFNLKEIQGYLDLPIKQFTVKIVSQIVSTLIVDQNHQFNSILEKKQYLIEQIQQDDFFKNIQYEKSKINLSGLQSSSRQILFNQTYRDQSTFNSEIKNSRKANMALKLILPNNFEELQEIEKKVNQIQSTRPALNYPQLSTKNFQTNNYFTSTNKKEQNIQKKDKCSIF